MKKQKPNLEIKTILKEQRLEYQRYLGVLTEKFVFQVKIISESLLDTQKQLKSIKELIAKNTEDIEIIKIDIQIIKQDLKQKVDRNEFSALERRVGYLESKIRR